MGVGNKMTIVITGASKGIGYALAQMYFARGYDVVTVARSEKVDLDIEQGCLSDAEHKHFQVDLTDMKAVQDFWRQCPTPRCLINNVGAANMNAAILTPDKVLEDLFKVNVATTFANCREAAKKMGRNRYGRIINFTTVAAPLYLEGEAVYAACKSSIETLTRVMAKELGSFGITVNAIGPCPVDTDLIKKVPKHKIEELLEQQAIKRKATFKDVFNAVDFFRSSDSKMITGQILYLGGVF